MTGRDPASRQGAPPFYILSPRYDSTSAGVRVLHMLAAELERAGHEALISWSGPPGVDFVDEIDFKPLTERLSTEHFKAGRTPVCIRPEVLEPAPVGVDVVYVLNVPGLLGGPAELQADHVIAYSERLARGLLRCDGVVHLPASDPDFWTPGPPRERTGACVYSGKYVEEHGQRIPPDLADAVVITRSGPDAPSPEAIRELLRSSTHCYIFENTSLGTEALLCGCVVVVRRNSFFHELIAADEHGGWGVTEADDPASLDAARIELPRFREAYLAAIARARGQVEAFARATSDLARARKSLCPMPTPRRVEIRQAAAAPESSSLADEVDVAFCYNLFLGREVEGERVFRDNCGTSLDALFSVVLRSDEFTFLAKRSLTGDAPRPALTVVHSLEALKAWIERRVPLLRQAAQKVRAAPNWPAVHAAVIADHAFTARIEASGLPVRRLSKAVLDFSLRSDIRGHVDEVAAETVTGWALDLNAPLRPVEIEVSQYGRVLVETVTGEARPDVLRLAGGDGRAGFRMRTPLLANVARGLRVRAGADRVLLPRSTPGHSFDGVTI